MRRTSLIALSSSIIAMAASISLALYRVSDKGAWPKNWPKELDLLRNQSRTLTHHSADIHEIPFTNREECESAWPHILTLKSKGVPLQLLGSPHNRASNPIKAGVRIHCPHTGELVAPDGKVYPSVAKSGIPAEKFLKVGPPWPDYLKSGSGTLPEYVVVEEGKWQPFDRKQAKRYKLLFTIRRTQTAIELIVDGDIVDLNRIPLPPDTPIIDKRFKERHDKTDTDDDK